MNSKISKRTNKLVKSVLASLLVSSNFLNLVAQNAKCMDSNSNSIMIPQQQNENKYVRCIDDKFILDMLKDYAYYKKNADYERKIYDGYRFIDTKFKKDFKYLEDNVFNENLSHDFGVVGCVFSDEWECCIESFNSYAVVHVIKTFFEKHEPIRLAFNKLYNKKVPKMKFFVKEFSGVGDLISGYSRHKLGKSITLEVFWNYCKKNGNYVGFEMYNSGVNNRLMPNLIGLYGQSITLAYELYNGLSSETRKEIENMINSGDLNTTELYGMLYIIYNTLHELTHCTIFCLRYYNEKLNLNEELILNERLNLNYSDDEEELNPIYKLMAKKLNDSMLNGEFENCFRDNNFSELIKKFKHASMCNKLNNIESIASSLKALKENMNSGTSFDASIAKFHGFTDRSTANYYEFIAELGALGNMPNCHDFINPKNFVELLDLYAQLVYNKYY